MKRAPVGGERARGGEADAGAAAGDEGVVCHACSAALRASVALHLCVAGAVLLRRREAAVAEFGGGAQRPVRIHQVRARERAEIGAAGGEDRVDVIGLEDVADGHGLHARFVADAVAEGRLEHAAVDGARERRGLAGGDVDEIGAGLGEGFGDGDGVFGA